MSIYMREGATNHVVLNLSNASGYLWRALRNTTLLGAGSVVCAPYGWWCLEFYFLINDSTGVVTTKINGVQDIALTSVDTKNAGVTGNIDNIAIGGNGATYHWDDIAIATDWPGQHGIYTAITNGAGDNADYTASSGADSDCVNDAFNSAEYTKYLSSTTVGHKSDFALADVNGTFSSYGAVQIVANAKLAAAGSGSVRPYIDSGGTDYNGTTLGLSTSPLNATHVWNTDPADSTAWTAAKINALKGGVEVIS